MRTTNDFLQDYEQLLREAAERLAVGHGPKLRARRARRLLTVAVPVVAGLGLVAAGAWLAVNGVVGSGSNQHPNEEIGAVGAGQAPTPASPAFSVLEGPRQAGDTIPADVVAGLSEDAGASDARIVWSQGRKATVRDGYSVYVAPAGDDQLCMLADDDTSGSSLTCATRASAARGGLMIRQSRGDATVVIGLVPDGVASVTVDEATARSAPVSGNAFVVSAGNGAGTVTWTDSAGEHVVDLPASPLAQP